VLQPSVPLGNLEAAPFPNPRDVADRTGEESARLMQRMALQGSGVEVADAGQGAGPSEARSSPKPIGEALHRLAYLPNLKTDPPTLFTALPAFA